MKPTFVQTALGFGLLMAAAGSTYADGWQLPSLNPFSSKKPPNARPRFRAPRPAEPSAWSKFNQGVKSFFSKTADTLTPWDNDKSATVSFRPNGRMGYPHTSARMRKPEPEKKSFFSPLTSMFKSKPAKPKKARSVTDFLNQPRPY